MWYRRALEAILASDTGSTYTSVREAACEQDLCWGAGHALCRLPPLSQGSQSSESVTTCSLWFLVGSKRWTDWVTHSSLRNLSLASRCHSRCGSQKVHGERPQRIGSRGARSKRAGQRGEKNRGPTHRSRHTNYQTEAMKPLRWCHTWAPRQCFWNVSSTPILTIKSPLPRQNWVPYK